MRIGIREEGLRKVVREELREKSEYYVKRVLSAKDLKDYLPETRVGVISPFVIQDPDTYQSYLLFTSGWEPPPRHGTPKKVYMVPIDEKLDVDPSKARMIASGALFGVEGLETVDAVWEDYNEEWLLFVTFYPYSNNFGVIRLDRDFNIKGTQVLSLFKADGTPNYAGDAHISPVILNNNQMILSGGYDANRSFYIIQDVTARPLGSPNLINKIDTTHITPVSRKYMNLLNAHQTLVASSGLIMLSEVNYWLDNMLNRFTIQVYYGLNEHFHYPFFMPCPIVPPLHINLEQGFGGIGQPHYTNLLGEPYLFFARATQYEYLYRFRRYYSDIYAVRVDPDRLFNPYGKVLIWAGANEPYTVGERVPIPTFGAKTVTIFLTNVSASGTLTVIEGSPYDIYNMTNNRIITNYSISTGGNKIVIDRPYDNIALKTDVNLSRAVVIIDLR